MDSEKKAPPFAAAALWALSVAAAVLAGQLLARTKMPAYIRETVMFGVMWAAMYPLARMTWLRGMPGWRHWAGLAMGLPVGFALSLANHGDISDHARSALIACVAAFYLVLPMWPRRFADKVPRSARIAIQSLGAAMLAYAVWLLNASR